MEGLLLAQGCLAAVMDRERLKDKECRVQEELQTAGRQQPAGIIIRNGELEENAIKKLVDKIPIRANEVSNVTCQASQDEIAVLTALLKTSASEKDVHRGNRVHSDIIQRGLLEQSASLGSTLVSMYAKCDAPEKVQGVFEELPTIDVVSWNALIAGYVQLGLGNEALHHFEKMQLRGFSPTPYTLSCILKACAIVGASDKGQEIHGYIMRENLLEGDVVLGNALVGMYAKCGALEKAQEVFNNLPIWNIVSWNALISGYTQHEYNEKALGCFEQMQLIGFSPNAVTIASILKACANSRALSKGQQLHAQIVRGFLLENDVVIGNALLDMYAKCGALKKAHQVFDELPVQNIVSWNSLADGYTQHGQSEEAINCFEQMQLKGAFPDAITYTCVLRACGSLGALNRGVEIHAQMMRDCLLEEHAMVATALVDMYGKCGALARAQEVFDKVSVRNTVLWNALITGYSQLEQYSEEALYSYEQMQHEGCFPDSVTFARVLKACGSLGAACMGQHLHVEVVKLGMQGKDMSLDSSLLVMYANCGMTAEAHHVFDILPVQEVVSWSALILGYAQYGKDIVVFDLFNRVLGDVLKPNAASLCLVLNTCSHAGLVEKGQTCFETVSKGGYDMVLTLDHHTCMMDVLGRAGQLEVAAAIVEEMPFSPDLTMWRTLLGACQRWENLWLGRWAFELAVQVDEQDEAAYTCIRNLFYMLLPAM